MSREFNDIELLLIQDAILFEMHFGNNPDKQWYAMATTILSKIKETK